MMAISINEQTTKEKTKLPKGIVFDWDDVFSFAKHHVNRTECLVKVISGYEGARSLTGNSITGSQWRTIISELAKKRFPNNESARYDDALRLSSEFLNRCLAKLTEVYQRQGKNVLADWGVQALNQLSDSGTKVQICSGTILEELQTEVALTNMDLKVSTVWGYPVRKTDMLYSLMSELQCDPENICLVDDAPQEIFLARLNGFAGILVENQPIHQNTNRSCYFQTENSQTDAFERAIQSIAAENPPSRPQFWARQFLGDEGEILGTVNSRFNTPHIWQTREKKTGELFFCKVLEMPAHDAERLGEMLQKLKGQGLPVSSWMQTEGHRCIKLSETHCIVMERAIHGKPMTSPYPDEAEVTQCAQVLAKLHQGLSTTGPKHEETFRKNFSTGLNSIHKSIDALWHLLIYSHQYHKHNRVDGSRSPVNQFHSWLQKNGKGVLLRLEKTEAGLQPHLQVCRHQWVLGDFNYSNILFDQSVIAGVVDFEDVHLGPRELDVMSFCMFGVSELHYPANLDQFVRAYCHHHPEKLNVRALGPIARAVVNVRLARMIRKLASLTHLGILSAWTSGENTINYLNRLCEQLADFEFDT